jgi:hypothetical protein
VRTSRRTVLSTFLAAGIAVPIASTAGCTLSGPSPQRSPARRSAEIDPDVALLDEVVASTSAMVVLYEQVLDRHRSLRAQLRPMLAAHRAHAAALGDAAPSDGEPSDGEPGGQARAGTTQPDAPADRTDVPRQPAAAVRELTGAERRLSRELFDATRQAASGPFARLLASMSASAAQRVQVLGEVAAR